MRGTIIWCGIFVLFGAAALPAAAGTVGFVNSPSTNSTDWTSAVNGLGGTIDTGVDFDAHPSGALPGGALIPTFYSASHGVTLTSPDPVFVAGGTAGSGNTSPPTSTGEGLHDGSNRLVFPGQFGITRTLLIDLDAPVLGVGFFLIDLWNPAGNGTVAKIEAFDGAGATGNLLGTFTAPDFNFQNRYQTYMGVVSTDADIRSVRFTSTPLGLSDSVAIDDIRIARAVPLPPAAWLGLGLLGALGAARWRRRSATPR